LHSAFNFLAGGGEMGALMRAHDWSSSALGEPASWPTTLKTAVRILLTSNNPMFIWWGEELLQFYNDAYRQTMGPERHPAALGQAGRECWADVWPIVGPDVEQVMQGRGAVRYEKRLVPLVRHGRHEGVWWAYGYSPLEDESGVRGVLVICNDVTSDHDSRERLEETYQTVVGTMDEAFCIIEIVVDALGEAVDYRFVETNRAFDNQTGLVDAVGKTARELIPGLEQEWIDVYADIAATGAARRFVLDAPSMGRWFTVYASRVGEPARRRVALLFNDISAQKEAEQALRASELLATEAAARAEAQRRQLDALLEAAPVGIVYVDPRGGVLIANAMNRAIWGEHPISDSVDAYAEWKGWWADDSERNGLPIQPHEWPLARVLAGAALATDTVEIEPFGQTGVRRSVLVQAAPIRDSDGSLIGAVVANMDVSNAVTHRRALRESEAKFRTIADAIPQLVWAAESDGSNNYTNRRWAEFAGVSEDETLGDRWFSLIHPDDLPQLRTAWDNTLATGSAYEVQYRVRHHSGIFRWMLSRALPVGNEHGQITRWMGTLTDIHDAKTASEQLKVESQRKDEFLAMLAHELRNPLAPISTAAQILKLPRVDPERIAQASDVIARQVRHMTELVDDLLDVSRVTRGLVDLQRVPVDIKSVAGSAIEQARPLIEGRKHALTTHIASAPALVLGDRKRLVQVMVNLLNNAAKYTAPGGAITLAVDVLDDEVRFSVADNGSGIDPLLLPKIFELFTQAERTPDRGQGGLGLGLALVKSMIGLHGGRIEARSDGPGKGSVFRAHLPRTAAALEPAAVAGLAPASVAPMRIMVVDDNLDAAESLATLLEAVGHQVRVAEDGAGALARGLRDVPDVFILDIGLPGIDGFELARRLRANSATRHCRLIALSGYGQAQDLAMSAQAGFDHHLVKPVETARLFALLDAGTDSQRFGTLIELPNLP
jgi:PAS domain S-box-containing protein